jgi:peptidoglycan/xylan/chitin deacetylase (PgdA/CDA1 family)
LYQYLYQGQFLPDQPILISFDDGYQALKETATPFLSALGMVHTHFINSQKMGKTSDWVTRAPDIPLLSATEIQTLAEQYTEWIDFQAHGESHLDLSLLDQAKTRQEIGGCVQSLSKLLNKPVNYLAYAFGEYKPDTPEWIAPLGVNAAFTVLDQGQIEPGQNPYLLPRVEIFSNDNWLDFRLKVYRGRSPIASSRAWIKHRYHKYRKKLAKRLP